MNLSHQQFLDHIHGRGKPVNLVYMLRCPRFSPDTHRRLHSIIYLTMEEEYRPVGQIPLYTASGRTFPEDIAIRDYNRVTAAIRWPFRSVPLDGRMAKLNQHLESLVFNASSR